MFPIVGGTREDMLSGDRLFCILLNIRSLCFFLRSERVSQPVSRMRDFIETNLVAPVTIRAASNWIFQVLLPRTEYNCSIQHRPTQG